MTFEPIDTLEIKKMVSKICGSRPVADHSIEQYLMTEESYLHQLSNLYEYFYEKSIYMIGDDDHFAPSFIQLFKSKVHVIEVDPRIIKSLRKHCGTSPDFSIDHKDLRVDYDSLIKHSHEAFDCIYINPPYNSKNDAYGIKIWTSLALANLKPGGTGVIVLPITQYLDWTYKNILILQQFLSENNSVIYDIKRNQHFYIDVPDLGLCSSNIYIKKLGKSTNLIKKVSRNLYR